MTSIINVLRSKLGKYPLIKKVLLMPSHTRERVQKKKSIKRFQKYGVEALNQFNACMSNNGFKYQLAFGTLLGAVREKDFIPHDDDLDFTMWIDDYKPEIIDSLRDYGFKLVKTFSVDGDKFAKEDTFEYKGIYVDIFYVYKDDKGEPYTCYFVNQPGCTSRSSSIKKFGGLFTRRIYLSASQAEKKILFKGIEVSIPDNYDEVMRKVFGDNYLTPIPGWSHKDFSESMPNWLCIYKEYK